MYFIHLRPRLLALVFSALQNETDPLNLHLLLGTVSHYYKIMMFRNNKEILPQVAWDVLSKTYLLSKRSILFRLVILMLHFPILYRWLTVHRTFSHQFLMPIAGTVRPPSPIQA